MRALTDPTYGNIMITESPRDSQGESRLDIEPEDFDGDGDVDADDHILRYYLRLVALLEACCCEQNTLATGIVQNKMPENNIFDEIHKAGAVGDVPRKTIFARLLYSAYLDTRRFGSHPHSGFGVGFERLVLYATAMGNIRDIIPFPRTVGQMLH